MDTQLVNDITLLFTDIEGSTSLWRNFPEPMKVVLPRHDEIIDSIVIKHEGQVVRDRGEGDSRFVVFKGLQNATNAVHAAAEIQKALHDESWQIPVPLRVRIALHSGDANKMGNDYYGVDVNRCAGIRALAHGGQTLLSAKTALLVSTDLPFPIQMRDLQRHYLKGDPEPEHLFQLVVPGIPNEFLPLKRQPPPESVKKQQSAEQRKRQALIENVYRDWIDGVLNRSLQQSAMLNLGINLQPNAVVPLSPDTVNTFLNEQGQTEATQAEILKIYKRFNGQLLILGAPGSGKSTVLLVLLEALLREAEWDATVPMPVLFNLSSWASKRYPLETWLIEELERQFRVPKAMGKTWVQKRQLIPLLDGLDEVIYTARDACVTAINAYQRQHSGEALVVCCRTSEYVGLQTTLTLGGVGEVQPLTVEEIVAYFGKQGIHLHDLGPRLAQDEAMWELITSPLMASFLSVIQDDLPTADADMSSDAYRNRLLKSYVEKMLTNTHKQRPPSEDAPFDDRPMGHYSLKEAQQKLSWLANWLHERNETIFYIEHLQPDVLPLRYRRWYTRTLTLVLSLIIGLAMGFGVNRIDQGIVWMVSAWLMLTILRDQNISVSCSFPWARPFRYHNSVLLAVAWSISESGQLLLVYPQPFTDALFVMFGRIVLFGVPTFIVALTFATIASYLYPLICNIYKSIALPVTVALWIASSVGFGLIPLYQIGVYFSPNGYTIYQRILSISVSALVCSSLFIAVSQEIRLVERLQWSWPTTLMVSFLTLGAFLWNQHETAILSACILISSGLTGISTIEERHKPNQGVWQSERYTIIGAGVGILIWFCLWLVSNQYIASIQIGPRMLPSISILIALRSGLIPCLQHLLVRLCLSWDGVFGLKGVEFLEDMARRSLLYRTGGGYLFGHRFLQEHFVSLVQK